MLASGNVFWLVGSGFDRYFDNQPRPWTNGGPSGVADAGVL